MKKRKIWIRKKKEKGKLASYIVEGQTTKRKEIIWTISKNLMDLMDHLIKTSFFTKEKAAKIRQKLDSLVIKLEKETKPTSKVLTRKIKRTKIKDSKPTSEDLWGRTK